MAGLNEKGYFALKARMYSVEKKYYGIFLLILSENEHSTGSASAVISLSPQVYKILPSQKVSDFEDRIQKIKFDGQYALSATKVLEESLVNISQDKSFYQEVENDLVSRDEAHLASVLRSFISKVLEDNSINVELGMESVNRYEFDMNVKTTESSGTDSLGETDGEVSMEGNTDDTKNVFQIEKKGSILDLNLVLDPVGGRLVSKLNIGDIIMVRVLPNSSAANHFINIYKLRSGGDQILPIPVEVKSINNLDNKIELQVKIDDNTFGRVIEEEKILVKMYDSMKYRNLLEDNSKTSIEKKLGNNMSKEKEKKSLHIIVIGAIVIFVLFFLILALILS